LGDNNRGRRRYDHELKNGSDEEKINHAKKNSKYYEGREAWRAMMIFDVVGNEKAKYGFLDSFLSDQMINEPVLIRSGKRTIQNPPLIANFYRGKMSFNGLVPEILLMGGDKGKKKAIKIAKSLEGLMNHEEHRRFLFCTEGFGADILRLAYIGGGNAEYKSFLSRLKKIDSRIEADPRGIISESKDRLQATENEIVKILKLQK